MANAWLLCHKCPVDADLAPTTKCWWWCCWLPTWETVSSPKTETRIEEKTCTGRQSETLLSRWRYLTAKLSPSVTYSLGSGQQKSVERSPTYRTLQSKHLWTRAAVSETAWGVELIEAWTARRELSSEGDQWRTERQEQLRELKLRSWHRHQKTIVTCKGVSATMAKEQRKNKSTGIEITKIAKWKKNVEACTGQKNRLRRWWEKEAVAAQWQEEIACSCCKGCIASEKSQLVSGQIYTCDKRDLLDNM